MEETYRLNIKRSFTLSRDFIKLRNEPCAWYGSIENIYFRKLELILSSYNLDTSDPGRRTTTKTLKASCSDESDLYFTDTYSIICNSMNNPTFFLQVWHEKGSLALKLKDASAFQKQGISFELEWDIDIQDEAKAVNLERDLILSYLSGKLKLEKPPEKSSHYSSAPHGMKTTF